MVLLSATENQSYLETMGKVFDCHGGVVGSQERPIQFSSSMGAFRMAWKICFGEPQVFAMGVRGMKSAGEVDVLEESNLPKE